MENKKHLEFKKVGARNIKTAIAVVISVFISKMLRMEYPFYAAIAATICMQGSVENSFKIGKQRMLGTIVGAMLGFIFAVINPENLFLIGLGIVAVIYLCNLLNWKDSASIACVVFCAIMLNLKGNSPILYSVNRIIDTFVGITVALGVNYFIMPPKKEGKA